MKMLSLIFFSSMIFFPGCEYNYMDASKTYAIGNTGPGGGIVFYVTNNGYHGLEAAQSDQSSGMYWSNIDSVAVGPSAQATAVGYGSGNSEAIIIKSGHINSAAKLCRDYIGGGKSDWFLPSRDELNLMYDNLQTKGYGTFNAGCYWSSSEFINMADTAWDINFNGGKAGGHKKNTGTFNVRAIRAF